MEKKYQEYLNNLEREKEKYQSYEDKYMRIVEDKRVLEEELHKIKLQLELMQQNDNSDDFIMALKNKID